ncbi:unnamed protein product [Agarophyton chilense]
MFQLTLTLATFALCILQSRAIFKYDFITPTRPHEAASTVIEETIDPSNMHTSDSIGQYGFFPNRHSPSASISPFPSILPSPVVISPYSYGPTKTPTPLPSIQTVGRSDFLSSAVSAQSPRVSSAPTFAAGAASFSDATVSPTRFSTLSGPAPSPSTPFMKRVIAIPLRIANRRAIQSRKPSPPTPSFSPLFDVQPPALLPLVLRTPFPYITPIPSEFVSVAQRAMKEDQSDCEDSKNEVSDGSQSPSQTIGLEKMVDRRYAMGYLHSILRSDQTVTPMPQRPKDPIQAEQIIPDSMLQKMFNASPFDSPVLTALPSSESLIDGASLHAVETNRLENAMEYNTPSSTYPILIPEIGKTHVHSVFPSPAPSQFEKDKVRMIHHHRLPMIILKKETITTEESSLRTKDSNYLPFLHTTAPDPSISVNAHYAYPTPLVIKEFSVPAPTYPVDLYHGLGQLSMEMVTSPIPIEEVILQSDEVEYYCESVKQCMCATISSKSLSPPLLSYCDRLDELTSSVCEQSREAHIFFEFWRTKQGVEGMALVNECAPEMADLL